YLLPPDTGSSSLQSQSARDVALQYQLADRAFLAARVSFSSDIHEAASHRQSLLNPKLSSVWPTSSKSSLLLAVSILLARVLLASGSHFKSGGDFTFALIHLDNIERSRVATRSASIDEGFVNKNVSRRSISLMEDENLFSSAASFSNRRAASNSVRALAVG